MSVYDEGHKAAFEGLRRDSCPYPTRSTRARVWLEGYDDGLTERWPLLG